MPSAIQRVRAWSLLMPLAATVAGLCGGCASPTMTATSAPSANAANAAQAATAKGPHERYVDAFMAEYWAIEPAASISADLYDHAAELPAYDQRRRDQALAFYDAKLAALAAHDQTALTPNQRADIQMLQSRITADRWALTTFKEWQWNPAVYNVAEPFELLLHTDYAPLDTRLRAVLARLAQVPAYYAAAQANIERPTLEHTDLAIEQNQGARATLGDAMLAAIHGSGLTPAEQATFERRAAEARAAIDGYVAFLQALRPSLVAGGARSFRIGREAYNQKFALEVQTGFTADALVQRALREKDRLHAQMAERTAALWPTYFPHEPMPADRLVAIRRMLDMLSLQHIQRGELVGAVRQHIPQLEAFVRDHDLLTQDPSKPLKVRETPVYMRGVAGASVSAPGPYNPGAETFYNVTPLDGESDAAAESYLREYNRWMLQILDIHEAIPGHYTQLLHANQSPSIVKSVFGDGATIEGWAVYGERMMLTAGYGNDAPELWLFWMKWNLRSVCNTILDHAIHTEGMTREQMLDLLVREAFQQQAEAEQKWRRATVSSVQLTSYFAGYASIWEFREAEQKRLGTAFDLKAFHDRFLSFGSAPVPVIVKLMAQNF